MDRIKKPRDWTLQDFIDYTNYRACDGNWGLRTAMFMSDWRNRMPKFFRRRWWNKYKAEILNMETEARINIKTGQVINECPYEVEVN